MGHTNLDTNRYRISTTYLIEGSPELNNLSEVIKHLNLPLNVENAEIIFVEKNDNGEYYMTLGDFYIYCEESYCNVLKFKSNNNQQYFYGIPSYISNCYRFHIIATADNPVYLNEIGLGTNKRGFRINNQETLMSKA